MKTLRRLASWLFTACIGLALLLSCYVAVRLMCVPWRLDDLERKIDAIAERVEQ